MSEYSFPASASDDGDEEASALSPLSSQAGTQEQKPWERDALPPRRTWRMVVPGMAVFLFIVVFGMGYLGVKGSLPLPASLLPGEERTVPAPPVDAPPLCGDSLLAASEQCDDGNGADGDGCSLACAIEEGWICSAPLQCREIETCGNGLTEGTESCDDGNTTAGDGCGETCAREP